MNPKDRQRRQRLRDAAIEIAKLVNADDVGRIRVRDRPKIARQNTAGYCAEIGTIGSGPVRLEIWLDRFSGSRSDRFYAGFAAGRRKPILELQDRAPTRWASKRTIGADDIEQTDRVRLIHALKRREFRTPMTELLEGGNSFYGFYDPSDPKDSGGRGYFASLAVSFFIDVVRAFKDDDVSDIARTGPADPDDYAGVDRYRVRLHVGHERDAGAAKRCKARDDYTCRVCGLRFDRVYGKLGQRFAEAHHRVALRGLKHDVKTRVEDLVTVCANCHRMLHRMEGKREDVAALKRIVAAGHGTVQP